MQNENQRTITFVNLSWADVDEYINQHKIWTSRGSFVEFCVSKEIHKKKLGNMKFVEVLMLFLLVMIMMGILLIWMVK